MVNQYVPVRGMIGPVVGGEANAGCYVPAEDYDRLAAEIKRMKPVVEAVKRIADKAALGDQCDCAVCNAIRADGKAEGRE